MNSKDLVDFKNAMNLIATKISGDKKVLIGPLAMRLIKAAGENPGDQTIHQLAAFLQNRANNKELLISRAELKDVYNKFYVSNTRCAQYIEGEVEKTELPVAQKMVRDDSKSNEVVSLADPMLVSALEAAFDKGAVYKLYSQELEKSAEIMCSRELNQFPVKPEQIKVVAGKEDILLCQASYDTPKGKSNVLIPVEIKEGKALFPTVFVSNNGFETLNKDNLGQHLVRNIGKKIKANVDMIFKAIKTARYGIEEVGLNEVEQIVLRASAAKETPASYASDAILCQEMDSLDSPGYEAKISANKEDVESFASKLSSTKGVAEFKFGKNVVDNGREFVRKSLASFGYKNVQIAVAGLNDDSVIYAVATGNMGIKVPVKFENGLPNVSVVLANGMVESFDKAGINKLLTTAEDYQSAALASEFHGSKPSELIENIKSAIHEENYTRAEEVLNVLANSNDQKSYNFGLSVFMNAINNKSNMEKTASVEIQKCGMQINSPNSQHIICGHTGLPVHKVYQDANGDCLPLYRKNIDHTGEGASFLHSRIYFE